MNNLLNRANELNVRIIDTSTKQELASLKSQVIDLDKQALDLDARPFERKRARESISKLHRLLALKAASADTTKFSFQNDPIAPKDPKSTHTAPSAPQVTTLITPLLTDAAATKYTIASPESHIVLSHITKSIILTGAAPSASPGSIPRSVHLENASHCIVVLSCDGPIFVHDLHNAVLILRCHQLRLHNATNSTILAHVSNDKLVIENCTGLRIGRHPQTAPETCPPRVDDFNHPTAQSKSKNYTTAVGNNDYSWIYDIQDGALRETDQLRLPKSP